jgi:putative phosphoribosyl transferase
MFVAHQLQRDGFATLLLDLLTDEEADDRRKVFDIDLLANRLLLAKRWLEAEPRTQHLKIGYFGASTGAGVALQTAARGAEDDDQLLFAGQQIAGCLVHLNHRFIMATDDQ